MSINGNRLPFGLKDGRMVDVLEVKNGLACECVCPRCFSPLQANQGAQRSYFSHDPKLRSENCENAPETALHLMAKQLISENKFLKLPLLVIKENMETRYGNIEESELIEEERDVNLTGIIVEDGGNPIIKPDISATVDGKQFFIEIAVTHFVDKEKKDKLRSLGIPTIELNLSKLKRDITKSELFEIVINGTETKKWISNPKADGVRSKLKSNIKSRLRSLKTVTLTNKQNKNITEASKPPATHRWMRCEACRYLFQKSIEEFPFSTTSIECPDCGFQVSGKFCS